MQIAIADLLLRGLQKLEGVVDEKSAVVSPAARLRYSMRSSPVGSHGGGLVLSGVHCRRGSSPLGTSVRAKLKGAGSEIDFIELCAVSDRK